MKTILNVSGIILALAGGVFFLQGINVITLRSYMRGDPHWAVYGGIIFLAGLGLVLFANWKQIRKK